MARNGRQQPKRPQIEVRGSSATPQEVAAIAGAVERFLRDTAPAVAPEEPAMSPWLRAGILESTGHSAAPTPWGDGEPWGS